MRVSTPDELGSFIRGQRKHQGLTQDELAKMVPASQKWLSEVENGKATAEIGQVMRLLTVLGVSIDLGSGDAKADVVVRKRTRPSILLAANKLKGEGAQAVGTFRVRPSSTRSVKAGEVYTIKREKSDAPAIRFRRAATKDTDRALEQSAELVKDAFKRWRLK
ncbi:helix-turn-helix domain-containing protein [Pseudoroseomonas ludipueritiae]|uniref:Helix-turn-helix transcriptional regulator n=1 Tax=Pseudoroseomonas ludipueritiae TaxID=198093 RepID=A0ABR7R655_9PROT|nr:helix-turn-helix transcriptional regulator [Pseudoroseomonas ludipueritiae]